MSEKCMYCKCEIFDNREITVCDVCGEKVWGEKMFNAIKENMQEARSKGDLFDTPCVVEDPVTEIESNSSEVGI